jgi:DNA-binding XRE family transcriptional regulator
VLTNFYSLHVDNSPLYRCRHKSTFTFIMDIKKKFGNKVKKLRLEKGLSQEALALLADLDRTYIPSIEKGERNVSITVIEKLAKALKISIKDFFNED